jgi:ATP-binding cassette subfamily E protein 1
MDNTIDTLSGGEL